MLAEMRTVMPSSSNGCCMAVTIFSATFGGAYGFITGSRSEAYDPHAFALFLSLLGEALTAQSSPDDVIERQTGDGLLSIRLEPLEAHTWAEVVTDAGIFTGRDHRITITAIQAP